MLDQITGMQVFARVATLGSLSGAARALGVSQTMATKHVAAIEERLGVKLLYRTTRKITLTELGGGISRASSASSPNWRKRRRRPRPNGSR